MKPIRATALAVALVSASVTNALAGPVGNEQGPNLVTNASFESNLTGWTTSGFAGVGFDFGIDSTMAHTGSRSFQGGAIESLGFLTQTIATVAGASYNIDLWLASDGFLPNQFQVLWNGAVVFDRSDIFPQAFTQIVVDPLATGPQTTLSFGFRDDSGLLHLDDVSVRAVTAAVPEPSTLVLLGAGLAFAGRRAVRRRQDQPPRCRP